MNDTHEINKVIIGSLLGLNIITFFVLKFVSRGLGQKTYYHHKVSFKNTVPVTFRVTFLVEKI